MSTQVKLPRVERPNVGLHDIFVSHMAHAMNVSKKEVRAILKQTK